MVYHGEFGGAPLVHFRSRMARRSFLGRTWFFPPKKPKMTAAGRWWTEYGSTLFVPRHVDCMMWNEKWWGTYGRKETKSYVTFSKARNHLKAKNLRSDSQIGVFGWFARWCDHNPSPCRDIKQNKTGKVKRRPWRFGGNFFAFRTDRSKKKGSFRDNLILSFFHHDRHKTARRRLVSKKGDAGSVRW
jgi:hypothetical protein